MSNSWLVMHVKVDFFVQISITSHVMVASAIRSLIFDRMNRILGSRCWTAWCRIKDRPNITVTLMFQRGSNMNDDSQIREWITVFSLNYWLYHSKWEETETSISSNWICSVWPQLIHFTWFQRLYKPVGTLNFSCYAENLHSSQKSHRFLQFQPQ